MNTIVPIIAKASPVQTNQSPADSGASAVSASNHGFASAMETATAKPVRKSTASKSPDGNSNGGKLPAPGNLVPAGAQPLPQTTSAAAAAATCAAALAAAAAAAGGNGDATASVADSVASGATAGASAVASTVSNSTQALAAPGQAGTKANVSVVDNAVPAGTTAGAAAGAVDDADDAASAGAEAASNASPTGTDASIAADLPGANAATAAMAKSAVAPPARSPDSSSPNHGSYIASGSGTAAAAGQAAADAALSSDASAANSAADSATETDDATDTAAVAAVAAQNSARSDALAASDGGTSLPSMGPDAASTLAAAGAAATAAVAAGAARVITALAASTAIDEKHVRGGDSSVSAPAAAGIDGSAGMGAVQTAGTISQSSDVATATMKISASVDSSEFGEGLANQISTMVEKNITSAKLQVNPPSLGPIEVRIAVQGDSAQVWMVSHSAVTRDALQSSTPTLREMLGNQGFGHVSVDISQRSFQDRSPSAPSYSRNSDADRGSPSAAASTVGSVTRASSGVLDAYA